MECKYANVFRLRHVKRLCGFTAVEGSYINTWIQYNTRLET